MNGSSTFFLVLTLLLSACSTPIHVKKSSFAESARQVHGGAVTGLSRPSEGTQVVLLRMGLEEVQRKDAQKALALLYELTDHDERPDLLFALAELWYLEGRSLAAKGRSDAARQAHMNASFFAWQYLFSHALVDQGLAPYRSGDAMSLYNYATVLAFSENGREDGLIAPEADRLRLLGNEVSCSTDTRQLILPRDSISRFLAADAFVVEGLTKRNRSEGLGAPLIAELKPTLSTLRSAAAATLLLEWQGGLKDFRKGVGTARLHLVSPLETNDITLAGKRLPLGFDLSAPTAYSLSSSETFFFGRTQFISKKTILPTNLYRIRPHKPGRIPVLLVHGTLSSPVTWATLVETLYLEEQIRSNFEFWFFNYNSSYPVVASAADLRAAVLNQRRELDPEGKDTSLDNMVVIGHSQGGLLTRIVTTPSDKSLWNAISDREYDSLKIAPEQKQQIDQAFQFEPCPGITRAIFIATPHRGSEMAQGPLRSLVNLFLRIPEQASEATTAFLAAAGDSRLDKQSINPNSINNMSPGNPWLLALAKLPFSKSVHTHSIIAVKDLEHPQSSTDGVVRYESAHLELTDTELVLQGTHAIQRSPACVEEVRRLLLLHLRELEAKP